MRTLSTQAATAADAQEGGQPIIVIKIDWDLAGSIYYSERAITIGSTTVLGRAISIGQIESVAKVSGVGEFSSMSFTLADDGTLKGYVNREVIAGTVCTVYQYFVGGVEDDMIVLLKGKLTSPTWDESSRQLKLSVETDSFGDAVGFAPEEDEFTGFNNDVAGTPWPMCFGTVLKVPAVRVKKFGDTSTLSHPFYSWVENMFVTYKTASNGDFVFPTETSIDIEAGGVKCTGQFEYEDVALPSGIMNMPVFKTGRRQPARRGAAAAARGPSRPDALPLDRIGGRRRPAERHAHALVRPRRARPRRAAPAPG